MSFISDVTSLYLCNKVELGILDLPCLFACVLVITVISVWREEIKCKYHWSIYCTSRKCHGTIRVSHKVERSSSMVIFNVTALPSETNSLCLFDLPSIFNCNFNVEERYEMQKL